MMNEPQEIKPSDVLASIPVLSRKWEKNRKICGHIVDMLGDGPLSFADIHRRLRRSNRRISNYVVYHNLYALADHDVVVNDNGKYRLKGTFLDDVHKLRVSRLGDKANGTKKSRRKPSRRKAAVDGRTKTSRLEKTVKAITGGSTTDYFSKWVRDLETYEEGGGLARVEKALGKVSASQKDGCLRIIACILHSPYTLASMADISHVTGISYQQTRRRVLLLVDKGSLIRIDKKYLLSMGLIKDLLYVAPSDRPSAVSADAIVQATANISNEVKRLASEVANDEARVQWAVSVAVEVVLGRMISEAESNGSFKITKGDKTYKVVSDLLSMMGP